MQSLAKNKLAPTPSRAPLRAGVLQRRCACGTHTIAGGDCESCGKDKVSGQLERSATVAEPANEVPSIVHDVLRSAGQPLDAGTRAFMESRFEHDFSQVRVHTDAKAGESVRAVNALAYTVGRDVVFGAGQYAPRSATGQSLLAHELTHVLQQSAGERGDALRPERESVLEREADSAAAFLTAPAKGQSHRFNPHATRLGLQAKKAAAAPNPELEFAMMMAAAKAGMTDAEARAALDVYKKLTTVQRQKAFNSFYPGGEITVLLRALKAADAAGPYREETAQILRWVEEAETRTTSGMTDDKMADVQAKFKQAEAQKEAQAKITAATPVGVAPAKPSVKDVEKAREEKVQQTSVAPTTVTTWDKMLKPAKDKWVKRGEAVIKTLVAHAAKNHPELKLTESNFKADFEEVEKRGKWVLAEGGKDGKGTRLAIFGFRFVEAAEVNPAYVMSVVVHEVFGHPEYGKYGTEYHLDLYDKAQAKMPGYKKPAPDTKERQSEIDAYAYQETEIYSLLRSLPYHTPLAAADQGKGLVSIDPASTVEARIGLIQKQWEPKLAVAILRGLYQRLLQDPRITGPAINAFRAGVKAKFPADEKVILK